jgi:uncharacterized protein (TIGR04255 family)
LVSKSLSRLRSHLKYSINEAQLSVEEGDLLLRWGVMPPNMSPDPGAIGPLPIESFILDIDVWSLAQRAFSASDLTDAFQKLAERAYSVFRFAVSEKFLKVYGVGS